MPGFDAVCFFLTCDSPCSRDIPTSRDERRQIRAANTLTGSTVANVNEFAFHGKRSGAPGQLRAEAEARAAYIRARKKSFARGRMTAHAVQSFRDCARS